MNDVLILCILIADSSHDSLEVRHSLNCSQRALLYSVSTIRISDFFLLFGNLNCCFVLLCLFLFWVSYKIS